MRAGCFMIALYISSTGIGHVFADDNCRNVEYCEAQGRRGDCQINIRNAVLLAIPTIARTQDL